MSDAEIINLIAAQWLSLGGDSDGFLFCQAEIAERIRELENAE